MLGNIQTRCEATLYTYSLVGRGPYFIITFILIYVFFSRRRGWGRPRASFHPYCDRRECRKSQTRHHHQDTQSQFGPLSSLIAHKQTPRLQFPQAHQEEKFISFRMRDDVSICDFAP